MEKEQKKDYSKGNEIKRRESISGAPKQKSWDLNSREVHVLEFLAGLDAQLIQGERVMEDRLRRAGAWQPYRCAKTMMEKALDRVYDTVPEKTLRHMVNLSMNGEVVIRPKNKINTFELQLVSVPDLMLICNTMFADKCRYCLNSPAEQKGCKLRKAFMRVVPPVELPEDGGCPYREIVQESDFERESFISY